MFRKYLLRKHVLTNPVLFFKVAHTLLNKASCILRISANLLRSHLMQYILGRLEELCFKKHVLRKLPICQVLLGFLGLTKVLRNQLLYYWHFYYLSLN
jgi:hypothetical protein